MMRTCCEDLMSDIPREGMDVAYETFKDAL
jgi:hypothetical protein